MFKIFLFLIELTLCCLSFAANQIWSKDSFTESCKKQRGIIHSIKNTDYTNYECHVANKEIMSVWFNNENKMVGWLNRVRDNDGNITMDQEFYADGSIKETSYYLKSDNEQTSVNIIVFNKEHEPLRGNIQLKSGNFVIVSQDQILKNGNPSNLSTLQKEISQAYNKRERKKLFETVEDIWITNKSPKINSENYINVQHQENSGTN